MHFVGEVKLKLSHSVCTHNHRRGLSFFLPVGSVKKEKAGKLCVVDFSSPFHICTPFNTDMHKTNEIKKKRGLALPPSKKSKTEETGQRKALALI